MIKFKKINDKTLNNINGGKKSKNPFLGFFNQFNLSLDNSK